MGRADAICDFMESLIDDPEELKDKTRAMRKDEAGDDNYLETYYSRVLPQVALEKIKQGYVQKFDKIIIDEGQDIIRGAGKGDGRSDGTDGQEQELAQCGALREAISYLWQQGIAGGQITILSPHRMKNSCVSGLLGQEKIVDFSDEHLLFLDRGAGDISFGTIYKFKGMENSCIIIADIASCLDRKNFEDLLYVGMSRARFGLVVLVNGEAMARLEALKKHK